MCAVPTLTPRSGRAGTVRIRAAPMCAVPTLTPRSGRAATASLELLMRPDAGAPRAPNLDTAERPPAAGQNSGPRSLSPSSAAIAVLMHKVDCAEARKVSRPGAAVRLHPSQTSGPRIRRKKRTSPQRSCDRPRPSQNRAGTAKTSATPDAERADPSCRTTPVMSCPRLMN